MPADPDPRATPAGPPAPSRRAMLIRFCAYTTLRNLRLFDAFFVLYLLLELKLSYAAIGGVLAYEKVLIGILETPLGVATDRWGRRRALVAMFVGSALAFALFAASVESDQPLVWIWIAQTVFALCEALRSGTHKAMILDWLTQRGEADQATGVIALTRVFSKGSAGVAALLGAVLVWRSGSFVGLFWVSALVSLLGSGLLLSYPRALEGEWSREAQESGAPPEPWWPRFRRVLARPGLLAVVAASILFETQIKLGLAYLQPYLNEAVKQQDLEVIGGLGALLIGAYALVQGLAAGAASALSVPWERRAGGRAPALRGAHATAVLCFLAVTASLWLGVLWPGLIAILFLACLQNLRRPILVARLNELMDPYQRATTLSLESQARSWLYAGVAVGSGALADAAGLAAAFSLFSLLIALGLLPLLGRTPPAAPEPPEAA